MNTRALLGTLAIITALGIVAAVSGAGDPQSAKRTAPVAVTAPVVAKSPVVIAESADTVPDGVDGDDHPGWSTPTAEQSNFAEGIKKVCAAAASDVLFQDVAYRLNADPVVVSYLMNKAQKACPENDRGFYTGYLRLKQGIENNTLSADYWSSILADGLSTSDPFAVLEAQESNSPLHIK